MRETNITEFASREATSPRYFAEYCSWISSSYARRVAAGSRVEKPRFTRRLEIMVNWFYPALQTASRLISRPPFTSCSS
jgi:hypothetical protein